MRISDWSSDVCSSDLFFATQFERQALGSEQDMPGQAFVLLGQIIKRADRFLRDDQKMHRCLRGDVVECQNLIIFVNDLGWNLPIDDLGKQSIHSCFRSEEHTSELQSLMRISYAVFCLTKKTNQHN